jgi:hypothetical protein
MLPVIPETPDADTMEALLRNFRQLDPDGYCEMCHRILPPDALSSDALSDQQLETISGVMVRALARQARKWALAKLH